MRKRGGKGREKNNKVQTNEDKLWKEEEEEKEEGEEEEEAEHYIVIA